jgi:hypothetical protein
MSATIIVLPVVHVEHWPRPATGMVAFTCEECGILESRAAGHPRSGDRRCFLCALPPHLRLVMGEDGR